jgi:hypothetical protein
VAILGALLLPALSRSKSKAQVASKATEESPREAKRELTMDFETANPPAAAPVATMEGTAKEDRAGKQILLNGNVGAPGRANEDPQTFGVRPQAGMFEYTITNRQEIDAPTVAGSGAIRDPVSQTQTSSASTLSIVAAGNMLSDRVSEPIDAGAAGAKVSADLDFKLLARTENSASQKFVRYSDTDADLALVSNAAPVLLAFTIEQTNRQLRVVDGDGSVYAGFFELETLATNGPVLAGVDINQRAGERFDQAARKDKIPPEATQAYSYSFQVTGTNLSLNQKVVFTGKLLTTVDSFKSGQSTGEISRLRAQPIWVDTLSVTSQPPALRISGTAVVDETKRIEIQAVPASPSPN